MKNKAFVIRLMDLVIIIALIAAYQWTAVGRAEREAAAAARAKQQQAEQRAASGTASVYKDGTYTGSGEGYGGTVSMQVTIEDDMITDIQAVSHSGEGAAYWDMASAMIPAMLDAQSPNVDTIAGATFSSTGIHNAVTDALKQALAGTEGE